MISPLFPKTFDKVEDVKLLRVVKAESSGIAVKLLPPNHPGIPVANVAEAEDTVFDLVTTERVFDRSASTSQIIGDVLSAIPIMILRDANNIASRTRRGAGNVAFMHPRAFDLLKQTTISACQSTPDTVAVGRWTLAGTLNKTIAVYTSDDMPDDEIIVAYVNEMDGPAVVANASNGQLMLFPLMVDGDALGEATDYLTRIRLLNVY